MGRLLMGYDIEFLAVGENLARAGAIDWYPEMGQNTTAEGLEIIADNHLGLGVPATLFVCGRTLTHSLPDIRSAAREELFDIQQHTYSHVLFKPDTWKGETFPASPEPALRHEVSATSALINEHLGTQCIGLRTPHGYFQGLSDRPDLVGILDDCGIRFVSSWSRNEEGGNPTPLDVQPFWYSAQGYDDILEIPFQFWLDAFWFEEHGRDRGHDFAAALRSAVDTIAERDLTYGVCFHDWAMLLYDEKGTRWVRSLLEYALERGVEVLSYSQFYERERNNRSVGGYSPTAGQVDQRDWTS